MSDFGIVEKKGLLVRQKLFSWFIVNDEALSGLGRIDPNDSINILVSHPVSESKDSLDFVPALKFIVKLGKRE